MKPFYLFPVVIATSICASAQVEGGFSYSLSLPGHEMKHNIRPVHSMNIIFITPVKKLSKLSWGIEAGLGQYASFAKDQDIRFPDGTGIKTKVTYSSNTATAGILTRFSLIKEAKKLNPYLAGKLGYANFSSKVVVADPENDDDCRPLEKKKPISDHSFFAAYGAGLQIDVSSKKKPKNAWIDISVSQLHGTKLDYINVKDIKDHIQNDPNNPAPVSVKSVPLSIRFVNVATQTIHEHQLAEVYNSPLRLLEMKIGVRWRLDND
jgi:hypothetical protein